MTSQRPLTEREFRAFQDLIHREAGIWLSPAKKALLTGRLSRRLRDLQLQSFGDYFRHLTEIDPEEKTHMLDCVSTNETRFFREPRQFDFIAQELLPAWADAAEEGRRARRIRVWSAGCSTGQEPYSLAMLLLAHCPASAGWVIEILATDLSTRVLERARAAVWPMAHAAEIPPAYLKRFMLRGVRAHEGSMCAGPELRDAVRFQRLNLNDADSGLPGVFDLVLCRNVLIYFNPTGKQRVLTRLLQQIAPDGYLFLGHSESLMDLGGASPGSGSPNYATGWRTVRPNIYSRNHQQQQHSLSAAS